MTNKEAKEAAKIMASLPEGHLKLISQILEDPKKGIMALELMISRTTDVESKKRLLNLKHSVERYLYDV